MYFSNDLGTIDLALCMSLLEHSLLSKPEVKQGKIS